MILSLVRYLGIDYGDTIGLALSDEGGAFAFPLENIPLSPEAYRRVLEVCRERGVGAIVIGDTRALNGGANRVTQASDDFAAKIGDMTGLVVHREQEAWSSVEAARFAPKGQMHNDAAAAAIILQRFLDRPRT